MALRSKKREYKPTLTVEEAILRVPNKPDPVRRKKRIKGKHTNKGLCEFLFEMFELNEKIPKNIKRTNAGLVDVIIKEFPSEYDLHVRLRKWEKTSINYYRQKYNTGALVPGRPVLYISFRYNEHGERVDYFTGKKLLTPTMQKRFLDRYRNKLLERYTQYHADHHEQRKADKEAKKEEALVERTRQRKKAKSNERQAKESNERSAPTPEDPDLL